MDDQYRSRLEAAGIPADEAPADFEGIAYLVGCTYDGALEDEWIVLGLGAAEEQARALARRETPGDDVAWRVSEVYVSAEAGIESTGYMVDRVFGPPDPWLPPDPWEFRGFAGGCGAWGRRFTTRTGRVVDVLLARVDDPSEPDTADAQSYLAYCDLETGDILPGDDDRPLVYWGRAAELAEEAYVWEGALFLRE